jgi:hypothetical protein
VTGRHDSKPEPFADRARAEDLRTTWPLFNETAEPPFPENPKFAVTPFRVAEDELATLEGRVDLPETTEQAEVETRRLRHTDPPAAPDWMRAARVMNTWLTERLAAGHVSAFEEAAIARTWTAFSLAGASEPQVLRVAHLVSRAHTAIRESRRLAGEMQAAIRDCAGVLHSGLPSAIRARMPLERAVHLVRELRDEADGWAAVVEGVSELLGWKDYARLHAAAVIHSTIERNR